MSFKFPQPEITNNLAQLRKRSGWSAAALAAEVGVSRQAIYAIESGTYMPNTALSLRLAQALGVMVDELFQLKRQSQEQSAPSVKVSLIPSPSELQTVQLARIEGRLVAVQSAPSEWYLPASDASASVNAPAGKISLRIHHPDSDFENRLIIAGCDPATSILARHLQAAGVQSVLVHQNSAAALSLLKKSHVHVAGTHLRGVEAINSRFSRESIAVISFAAWQEGFVTAAGNPKQIRSVTDLGRKGIRFINREKGAGTRLLLDTALAHLHMKSSDVRGYNREAAGHLAAALQVKNGSADCCIAIESAARAFGLTFVPLETARYDLVLRRSHLDLPAVRALLDTCTHAKFRNELSSVTGYDTAVTGVRVL
ncbi:MAG TPA: substrate-binding domain-containing protein [Bryobacteraceae bacterium]|nr:substrate-binding domain-containing protein [Bryobacteraceae bacterium]